MVKVKICGITNYDDALTAVELGADALGFIFAPSPRGVTPEDARNIIRRLPPFVKSVGVFVDEDPKVINGTVEKCGLDLVQLHGHESPGFCGVFMPRTIKSLRIKDSSIIESVTNYKGNVRALLLDTFSKDMAGGTGKVFDWSLAIEIKNKGMPIILAGGLGPDNIEDALYRVNPYAVDVNSGVEESLGKKDHTLMKELFKKIRNKAED